MADFEPRTYACKNMDENIRASSTSGGVFTSLCEQIVAESGWVFGAAFDENFEVVGKLANSLEVCQEFKGSKYPQSRLGSAFRDIKELLKSSQTVLFSGTPCQVAGLSAFLGKEYDRLFLLDFICMGVASPGVWKAYLSECFSGEKITSIRFKDKTHGWHRFSIKIDSDRRTYLSLGGYDPFMVKYLHTLIMRPSCYNQCKFKGRGRVSDITIADCWGVDKFLPQFDDDKGVSAVFVNTPKGARLFEQTSLKIQSIEIDFHNATRWNPYYHRSVYSNHRREAFFRRFAKNPVQALTGKTFVDDFVLKCVWRLQTILKKPHQF